MSNFLHSNNGSLFALEYSLLNKIPDQQASEQFADESEEEVPQTNTQAFDVGEAIALEYQEDTEPDFESMSSQYGEEDDDDPEAYTSRGFDLQSENIPTYDVEAFTIEDEETPQLNDNSLAKSHSLFALEQSVFASSRNGQAHQFAEEAENTELDEPALSESHSLFALEQKVLKLTNKNLASQQFAVAESFSQDVEAQAFDWDEAIALEYEASAYPTTSTFDWLPTDESSHNLEDESLPFEVEAFEVEEEPVSAPVDEDYSASRAYGFDVDDEQLEPKPEELNNSRSYGFDTDEDEPVKPTPQKSHDAVAIPVNATVATPPSPPLKSAQPVEALSDDDFDELEHGGVSDLTADAEAFAADLAAIMRGEKVYEPAAETPTPLPPAPQLQPAPQSQAQSVAPKKSSPHDIFDQMGRNMAHATAFDLGTFSLEQRFDEFDELLDREEQNQYQTVETQFSTSPDEEMQADEEMGEAMGFDNTDLMADLDRINTHETDTQIGTAMSQRSQDDMTRDLQQKRQQSPALQPPQQQRLLSIQRRPQTPQPATQQQRQQSPASPAPQPAQQPLPIQPQPAPQPQGTPDYSHRLWSVKLENLAEVANQVVEIEKSDRKNTLIGYFQHLMNWKEKDIQDPIGKIYKTFKGLQAGHWIAILAEKIAGSNPPIKQDQIVVYKTFNYVEFTYLQLFYLINKYFIKERTDNQKVADDIRQLVEKPNVDSDNGLTALIYLTMFGAETLRCTRWYVISMMILDLISAGKITWEQVFGERNTRISIPHYWPPNTDSAVFNSKRTSSNSITIQEENRVIHTWLLLVKPENIKDEDIFIDRDWVYSKISERFISKEAMLTSPPVNFQAPKSDDFPCTPAQAQAIKKK